MRRKNNKRILSSIRLFTILFILSFLNSNIWINFDNSDIVFENLNVNNAAGSWDQDLLYNDPGGTYYRGMKETDLENDGKPELIFMMDVHKMFIVNYTDGNYIKQDFSLTFLSSQNLIGFELVDYDKDGVKEIYLFTEEDHGSYWEVQIWQGKRLDINNWNWSKLMSINDTDISYREHFAADCDNDGEIEIIICPNLREDVTKAADLIYLEYNSSTNSFYNQTIDSFILSSNKAFVTCRLDGDIDNDGFNELYVVICNDSDGSTHAKDSYFFQYQFDNISRKWQKTLIEEEHDYNYYIVASMAIGDIDNDGYNELVYNERIPSTLLYCEYNGSAFVNHTTIQSFSDWYGGYCSIKILDIDNDGLNEICCGLNRECCTTRLYIYNGTGSNWDNYILWEGGEDNTAYLSFCDLDMDGKLEIYHGAGYVQYKELFVYQSSGCPSIPCQIISSEPNIMEKIPFDNENYNLTWQKSYANNLQNYHIQISENSDFSTFVVDNSSLNPNSNWYILDSENYIQDKLYWYRISAINGSGEGTFSTPFRFMFEPDDFYIRFNMTWTNNLNDGVKPNRFFDLDGDGILELIHNNGTSFIYTWTGDGYEFLMSFPDYIYDFGDYDGDGVKEVAIQQEPGEWSFIEIDLESKTWISEYNWSTGLGEAQKDMIHFGDFEHDGKEEFALHTLDGHRRVYSFNGTEIVLNASFDFMDWGDGIQSCRLVDIDGDNRDEVICGWGYGTARDGDIYIYDDFSTGFAFVDSFHFGRDPFPLRKDEYVDLTGDGILDLVLGDGGDGGIFMISYNLTTGNYESSSLIGTIPYPYDRSFEVGKIYPSEMPYLITMHGYSSWTAEEICAYRWNASEMVLGFTIPLNQTLDSYNRFNIHIKDINGDGCEEIIWDGKNSDGKQTTFFMFNRELVPPDWMPSQEDLVPIASFTTNITEIYEGESIQFTDLTTGGDLPLSYQWNFGDGSPNATDQSPIHQYNSSGIYSAILTVTDNDGDISVSQSLSISVISIVSTNGIWQSISAGINVINCIDDDGFLWMSVYLDVQDDGSIRLAHSSSNPSAISTPTEAECSHFYSIEINDSSVISENPTVNFFFPDDEYTESQKEQLSIYKLGSVNWTELSSTLYSSENKIYVSNCEVDSTYSLGYSISDDPPPDTGDDPIFVIPGYPMWIIGSISLCICILKILNIDYQKKKRNKGIII